MESDCLMCNVIDDIALPASFYVS